VAAISSDDIARQLYGMIGIRKILVDKGTSAIQLIIEANIVPTIL
jgi:hypothetical protein